MDAARQLRDSGDSDHLILLRERAERPSEDERSAVDAGSPATADPTPTAVGASRPVVETGGVVAGITATLGHFSQWFLLLGVVAALLLGTRWIASRTDLPVDDAGPRVGDSSASVDGSTGRADELARAARPAGGVGPSGSNGQPGANGSGTNGPHITNGPSAGGLHPEGSGASARPARAIGTAGESVLISSTPPGARILVDGLALPDQTPTRVPLQDGARIRLEAAGFEPLETSFRADRDARPAGLDYRLKPLPSSLRRVRAPADVAYPRKIRRVEPILPASTTGQAEGIVILALEIDGAGNVIEVSVLRGVAPAVDRAVLDAAWRWKFEPTEVDGRPVHVVANFTVPVGRD